MATLDRGDVQGTLGRMNEVLASSEKMYWL